MVGVLALLLAASSPSQVDATLERAWQLVGDLKFKQAAAALAPLRDAKDLERAQVLKLLELQARVAGSQGQPEEATRLFEALLELDPAFTIQGKASPKITSPYFEARAAVFKRGALELEVTLSESAGRVTGGAVSLKGRADRIVNLEATIDEDGVSRKLVVKPGPLPLKGTTVSVKVVGRDARGWVLVSRERTLAATPPPPAPIVEPAPAMLELPAEPMVPKRHPGRTVGAIALGGAAVAGIVGASFFGVGSNARSELERAVASRMGDVLPITALRADQLNASVALGRDGSTAAWISLAVLGAISAAAWLLDAVLGGS